MATLDLVLTEFILLAIVCFFLLRYFKDPAVTFDVTISVYFSWVLGFVGILLLPYDLSVAIVENTHSTMLAVVWKFIYWSTFLLAWVILPMQMEYHSSGHFTFCEKFLDALKRNILAGVAAAVAGVVYIVYMVATHRGSPEEVIGFMMAMGNTYGVFIIIILMGTGLVGLPRRLWQIANYNKELQRLYISASVIESSYQEARYELEDCELEVGRAVDTLNRPENASKSNLKKYTEILHKKVSNFVFASRSHSRQFAKGSLGPPAAAQALDNKAALVELHSRLMRAQMRARSCDRRWRVLLKKCKRVESLVSTSGGGTGDESKWCEMRTEIAVDDSRASNGCSRCLQSCWDTLYSLWSKRYLRHCTRALALICAALSALILWSEMVMSTSLHSPIGLMIGAYRPQHIDNTLLAQTGSFIALAYMSICTYWALFRVNLGWAYAIQGPQQSPYSSLIFNGEYFSRLQFSLGYNFLMTLNAPKTRTAAFSDLMSNIQLVPVFGTSFQVYIPLFMILVALLTMFDVFARLLSLMGIESDDPPGACRLSCPQTCCSKGALDEDSLSLLTDDEKEKYELGKKLVATEMRQSAVLHTNKTILGTTLNPSKPGPRTILEMQRENVAGVLVGKRVGPTRHGDRDEYDDGHDGNGAVGVDGDIELGAAFPPPYIHKSAAHHGRSSAIPSASLGRSGQSHPIYSVDGNDEDDDDALGGIDFSAYCGDASPGRHDEKKDDYDRFGAHSKRTDRGDGAGWVDDSDHLGPFATGRSRPPLGLLSGIGIGDKTAAFATPSGSRFGYTGLSTTSPAPTGVRTTGTNYLDSSIHSDTVPSASKSRMSTPSPPTVVPTLQPALTMQPTTSLFSGFGFTFGSTPKASPPATVLGTGGATSSSMGTTSRMRPAQGTSSDDLIGQHNPIHGNLPHSSQAHTSSTVSSASRSHVHPRASALNTLVDDDDVGYGGRY